MLHLKFFRYLGIVLLTFSMLIGVMLDFGFFIDKNIQIPVVTSFISFLLGMFFLIYVNDKTK